MQSTSHWIMTIIGQAIKQGLLNGWLMSWIKPNFNARDKHQLSNYLTIMVSPTIAKLCSTIMEHKVSAWVGNQNKQALGLASKFWTKILHGRSLLRA